MTHKKLNATCTLSVQTSRTKSARVSRVLPARLVDAAMRMSWYGAFTQADIGLSCAPHAKANTTRSSYAVKLRMLLESHAIIEAYKSETLLGDIPSVRPFGALAYALTPAGRKACSAAISRSPQQINASDPQGDLIGLMTRVLQADPSDQAPRKGIVLANRWMLAFSRFAGSEGQRYFLMGEFALRNALRFVSQARTDAPQEASRIVERMPDGLMVRLRDPSAEAGETIRPLDVTLVEIERAYKSPGKHFKIFYHFDGNGDLRPLCIHRPHQLQDPSASELIVLNPTCIQVVRIVERYNLTDCTERSGEGVTPRALIELAALYFFDLWLLPSWLRTERLELAHKVLAGEGALQKREFASSVRTATLDGFLKMLSGVVVTTASVYSRHGTLTDDLVRSDGGLRQSVKLPTLRQIFEQSYAAELALKTTPTAHKGEASPQAKPAVPRDARLAALLQETITMIADADIEGSESWAGIGPDHVDRLLRVLTPILNSPYPFSEIQRQCANACAEWRTGSIDEATEACVEIGYRFAELSAESVDI